MSFLPVISTRLFQGAFLCFALFIPFSIAGENIAIGFGVLAWLLWLVAQRGRLPRPDALFVASIVLALSALPSVWMSENRARAFTDWQEYWQLLICFLVSAHIARVGVRERSVGVLLFSAAASCGVAFVQRAGGLHLGPIHIGSEHRVSSTLFTMTLAGILCQLVPFAAAVALAAPARRWRGWIAAGAVMMFAALLLTMTRGAWIAVIAGLAVVTLLLRSRALAAVTALAVGALVLFSQGYKNDQDRTLAVDTFASEQADRNVATRLVLWDMSWHMFLDHPLAGVGMGDYSIEAEKRLAARHVRTTVDSHNIFLQVLATRGLLGFIPFVAYFGVLAGSLWTRMRASSRGSLARHYAAGALGVTAALLAGALTENNIDDAEVFAAFMFLVGVARAWRPGEPA
ncbi:MAG TPA: O-antigen ligase family protein [Candidatus Krumholzibacteria bacterium]